MHVQGKFGLLTLLGVALLLLLVACGSEEGQTTPENNQQSESDTTENDQQPESNATEEDETNETAFYEGETLTLMVGYAPGGGTDTEARVVAEHLPRFLPGEPNVQVINVPGAAGQTSVNSFVNQHEPDGMVVAIPGPTAWISAAVLGEPSVEYDLTELEWIGGSGGNDMYLVVSEQSGIESFDDLREEPEDSVLFGSWSRTSIPYIGPYILSQDVAPSINVVTGYDGLGDVELAMERGEVQGALAAASGIHEDDLESGKYRALATYGSVEWDGAVRLEDVLSEEDLQAFQLMWSPEIGYPMIAPPETDPEIVDMLRKAYSEMLADSDFIADAEAQSLVTVPIDGEEVEDIIDNMLSTPQEIIDRVKEIQTEE